MALPDAAEAEPLQAHQQGRGQGRGRAPGTRGSRKGSKGVSAPARALLRFSAPRESTALTAFIRLRVLNPEYKHWRRGIEAAVLYQHLHGDLRVPFTFRLPVESWAGALSEARCEQPEEIDPSWCPSWPVEWQRAFHLVRQHLDDGGTLPVAAGETVRQGEDLGRWVRAQRLGFDKLTSVQQWMCEHVLGITPRHRGGEAQGTGEPGGEVGGVLRRRPASPTSARDT
ncbi:hypothetical protein [Streptomyces sp. NPDC012825]|uniref:hypothetical protein n=1 Tax=Streptomyces sp. NPDC012825 TaxID=3364851 RepID=UPI0036AA7313